MLVPAWDDPLVFTTKHVQVICLEQVKRKEGKVRAMKQYDKLCDGNEGQTEHQQHKAIQVGFRGHASPETFEKSPQSPPAI